MVQSKKEHAEYMRTWRLKQKEKQDEIEKQIDKQAEKVSQQPRTKRTFDDTWREPKTNLEPQYPHKHDESMGCCLWGLPSDYDKPKPKSNQQILTELDPNHSE